MLDVDDRREIIQDRERWKAVTVAANILGELEENVCVCVCVTTRIICEANNNYRKTVKNSVKLSADDTTDTSEQYVLYDQILFSYRR